MFRFLLLCFILLKPYLLMAATEGREEAHGLGWAFVFKEFNFLILAVVLFLLLRKPVKDFFAARSATLREKIGSSREAHKEAETKHKEISKRLENIDQETKNLITSFKQEGEQEKKRIIEQARQFSEKTREDAKQIAASELRQAREELKEVTVTTAHNLAEKIVRQEMTEEDEERLNKGFVQRLKGLNS